jgi:hypothetical protein
LVPGGAYEPGSALFAIVVLVRSFKDDVVTAEPGEDFIYGPKRELELSGNVILTIGVNLSTSSGETVFCVAGDENKYLEVID